MPLSATALAEVIKEEGENAWLLLLTIDHPDLASPIRVVNSESDVVSRGDTFTSYPFEIILPDIDSENPPSIKLKIDNVDRQIYEEIWALQDPPTITAELVMHTTPDIVEDTVDSFQLVKVDIDEHHVVGEAQPVDFIRESYPGDLITPANFPGLW